MALTGNTIFEGPVKLYPEAANTANYYTLGSADSVSFSSVSDYLDKFTDINTSLAASETFTPTGTGPITCLFELDDVVYVGRTNAGGTGTKLWRTTDLNEPASDIQYEAVDMGYQVNFDAGKTKPFTIYDVEFLGVADPSDAVEDRLPTNAASQTTNKSVFRDTVWRNLSNLTVADDNDTYVAYATTSQTGGFLGTNEMFTDTLILTGFTSSGDATALADIAGVTVEIRHSFAEQASVDLTATPPQGEITKVKLANVGGSADKGGTTVSLTNTSGEYWESSFATSTFGGPTDTWSAPDLTATRVFNPNFGVELECSLTMPSASGTEENRRDFFISWVKVSVAFTDGTEEVYFWNGASDVSTANVVHIFKEKGEWTDEDAEGTLYLYNVSAAGSIVDGLQIRSAASGGGSLIAVTNGAASENMLPTWSEMEAEESLAQTIKANFYLDEAREAVYGVTGAGPAFTFDGDYYREIRGPVPLSVDKPRHIIEHQGHLGLGYQSGSILLSVPGEPTNFSGEDGASEWGFGDVITGLVGLSGNALGVLCEQSTHALVGTTIDNFTSQSISKSSGAIEYSTVTMGQPIYCDFRGVSSISATSNYGDFTWGRFSNPVLSWLQPRLQERSREYASIKTIVGALPIRNKGQYKLFFNDGEILTMTLFGVQGDTPMFTIQNYAYNEDSENNLQREYVPTALLSTVLSNGSELVMIGNAEGHVYVMEQSPGIVANDRIIPYDAFLRVNPFFSGAPFANTKFKEVMIHMRSAGYDNWNAKAGVNFLIPDDNETAIPISTGQLTDPIDLTLPYDRVSAYLPNITDGFTLELSCQADGRPAHIIQAFTYKGTVLSDKNRSPKEY